MRFKRPDCLIRSTRTVSLDGSLYSTCLTLFSVCFLNALVDIDSNKPDDSEQSHAKKQRISSHYIGFKRATTCPPFLSNTVRKWDWGPHITAQDAIQRFAPYERGISVGV